MTTKKLYKVKTQTILYEVFEIEAESYDKALDIMMPTVYDGTDDYPIQVERVQWWHDHKSVLDEDDDHKGLFGISITDEEEEADKTPYYEIVHPKGCFTGDWREPTEEEWRADQKQAVADGRLSV